MTLAARPSRRYPSESIPGLARKVDAHWNRMEKRLEVHMETCPDCLKLHRHTNLHGPECIGPDHEWHCRHMVCPRAYRMAERNEQIANLCEKLEGACNVCGAEKGECVGDHEE